MQNNRRFPRFAKIFRSRNNVHRFFYFLNGKLHGIQTDINDIVSPVAGMFGFMSRWGLQSLFQGAAALSLLGMALGTTLTAHAVVMPNYVLPTGYQSVSGNVQFSQSGNTLNVTTTAQRSIANYQTFNVGQNAVVDFNLPNSSSAILNRVITNNPASILGTITSNGQVFLVSPYGIFIGPNANINVGSLFGTTLNINDTDFLNNNLSFQQDPIKPAAVVNEGNITAHRGGFVALVGGVVQNSGTIQAPFGDVQLAVGSKVTATVADNIVVDIVVDDVVKQKIAGYSDALANSGTISSLGGTVKLQADLIHSLYDHVVNNTGRILANSVRDHQGTIILEGHTNDNDAKVQDTGTLDVSSVVRPVLYPTNPIIIDPIKQPILYADTTQYSVNSVANDIGIKPRPIIDHPLTARGKGGTIEVLGDKVFIGQHAVLDADGTNGGGKIFLGGDLHGASDLYQAGNLYVGPDVSISANALNTGNGGEIVLWSKYLTQFNGNVSATGGSQSGDGGYVEISGKTLQYLGHVVASANNGNNGTLLLDPKNILVQEAGSSPTTPGLGFGDNPDGDSIITPEQIAAITGNKTNLVLEANNDIDVNNAINVTGPYSTAGSLTLEAGRSISINASITSHNGDINLYANQPPSTGVIEAYRDAGAGGIFQATNTTINTGSANINISVGVGSPFEFPISIFSLTSSATPNIISFPPFPIPIPIFNSAPPGDIVLGNLTGKNVSITGQPTSNISLNNSVTADKTTGSITIVGANITQTAGTVSGKSLSMSAGTGSIGNTTIGGTPSAANAMQTSVTDLTTNSVTGTNIANSGYGDQLHLAANTVSSGNLTISNDNTIALNGTQQASNTVSLTAPQIRQYSGGLIVAPTVNLTATNAGIYGASSLNPVLTQASVLNINSVGAADISNSGNVTVSAIATNRFILNDSGSISVDGNIGVTGSGSRVDLTGTTIQETAGNTVSASQVNLIATGGDIGSTSNAFGLQTGTLSASASGNVYLTNTGNLTLYGSHASDNFILDNAGTLGISTGGIALSNAASGLISISANAISQIVPGTLAAHKEILTATSGNISNLDVNASDLTVTANNGSATIFDSNTNPLTLEASSAGSSLYIKNAGNLIVAGNTKAITPGGSITFIGSNITETLGHIASANSLKLDATNGSITGPTSALGFRSNVKFMDIEATKGSASIYNTGSSSLTITNAIVKNTLNVTNFSNLTLGGEVTATTAGSGTVTITAPSISQLPGYVIRSANVNLTANNGSIGQGGESGINTIASNLQFSAHSAGNTGSALIINQGDLNLLTSSADQTIGVQTAGNLSVTGTVTATDVNLFTTGDGNTLVVDNTVTGTHSVTLNTTGTGGFIAVIDDNTVNSNNGTITLKSDGIDLTNGFVNAGNAGKAIYAPETSTLDLDLTTAGTQTTINNTTAGTLQFGDETTAGNISLGSLDLSSKATDLILNTTGDVLDSRVAGSTVPNITMSANQSVTLTGGWDGTGSALDAPGATQLGVNNIPGDLIIAISGTGLINVDVVGYSGSSSTYVQQTTPTGGAYINLGLIPPAGPLTPGITPAAAGLSPLVLAGGGVAQNNLFILGNLFVRSGNRADLVINNQVKGNGAFPTSTNVQFADVNAPSSLTGTPNNVFGLFHNGL